MGLDVVEIVMDLEQELQIKIPVEVTQELWRGRRDIQVRDFVAMIVEATQQQNPVYQGNVTEKALRVISEHSGMPLSIVPLDAWFKQDLDLI